jgi:hypothetical protein
VGFEGGRAVGDGEEVGSGWTAKAKEGKQVRKRRKAMKVLEE